MPPPLLTPLPPALPVASASSMPARVHATSTSPVPAPPLQRSAEAAGSSRALTTSRLSSNGLGRTLSSISPAVPIPASWSDGSCGRDDGSGGGTAATTVESGDDGSQPLVPGRTAKIPGPARLPTPKPGDRAGANQLEGDGGAHGALPARDDGVIGESTSPNGDAAAPAAPVQGGSGTSSGAGRVALSGVGLLRATGGAPSASVLCAGSPPHGDAGAEAMSVPLVGLSKVGAHGTKGDVHRHPGDGRTARGDGDGGASGAGRRLVSSPRGAIEQSGAGRDVRAEGGSLAGTLSWAVTLLSVAAVAPRAGAEWGRTRVV